MLDHLLGAPGGLRLRSTDPDIAACALRHLEGWLTPATHDTDGLELVGTRIPGADWDDGFAGALDGDRLVIELSGARGELDLSTGSGTISVSTDFPRLDHYLDNILRMVLPERAARDGWLLCHGAGLATPERDVAAVFFGASGAGKSTMTRWGIEKGWRPLNDDLVFLHPETGRCLASPFGGDRNLSGRLIEAMELGGLFQLEQAERNRVTRLPPARAVAALGSQLVTWRARRLPEHATMLAAAETLCGSVPSFRLEFDYDADIWEIVGSEL